jgi:hypothetical protein
MTMDYSEEQLKREEKSMRMRNLIKVLNYGESVHKLKYSRTREELAELIDNALMDSISDAMTKEELAARIDPENKEEAEGIVEFFVNESLLLFKDNKAKMINDLRVMYKVPEEREEEKPKEEKKFLPRLSASEVSVASSVHKRSKKISFRVFFRWVIILALITAIAAAYVKYRSDISYTATLMQDKIKQTVSGDRLEEENERRKHKKEGEQDAIKLKMMLENYDVEKKNVEKSSKTATPE